MYLYDIDENTCINLEKIETKKFLNEKNIERKKITRLYKINGILGCAFIIAVAGIIVTYIMK